jgi:nucleotide-binding universal stress UspA family protein
MNPHRILVPVDFSEQSRLAMVEADALAMERDAHLVLMHVHPIVEVAVLDFTYLQPAEKVAELCEAVELRLKEWARSLTSPPERVTVRVATGAPVTEIVAAAKDFDLVVMATHGRTGVGHFLMGSVAERVVQGASCSVFVVKQRPPRVLEIGP